MSHWASSQNTLCTQESFLFGSCNRGCLVYRNFKRSFATLRGGRSHEGPDASPTRGQHGAWATARRRVCFLLVPSASRWSDASRRTWTVVCSKGKTACRTKSAIGPPCSLEKTLAHCLILNTT